MKQFLLAAFLVLPCVTASAQTWLEDPIVRICETAVTCDDRKRVELALDEIQYVQALLQGIPTRSTEADVTRHFGHAASSSTKPAPMELGGVKGEGYHSIWQTAAPSAKPLTDPRIEVYFFNGKAYTLKWIIGAKKMVQLMYVK